MASQGYEEELLQRWFPSSKRRSEPTTFTEKDIWEISSILERAGQLEWSRVPRLYIVLRLINALNTLERFINQDRNEFLETQQLVCNTRALNLERADAGHGHFPDPSEIPLKKVGDLGKGASGFVERVISTVTRQEYALKRIRRGTTFRKDKTVLRDFENELSTLKRLSREHIHIIELIASFTEPKYVGLLFPVADCNLAELMASPAIIDQRWSLRTYFGCLASALGFLHNNKIRHKDIKPQNILIKDHAPFFTDFGVSIDWTEYGQSTTIGPTAMTPRYCAPEVAEYRPRNSTSDIWSLGCVFLELFAVLKGATIKELVTHFTVGTQIQPYHSSDDSISAWIDHVLGLPGPDSDNLPVQWIRQILVRESKERWSAHLIVESIREYSTSSSTRYLYIGRCCLDDDDTTESVISYIEPLMGSLSASTFYETAPRSSAVHPSLDDKRIRQGGDYFCAQTDNVPANLDAELGLETASETESSDDQAEYFEDAHEEANDDGEAQTIKPDHEVTDQSLPKLSYTYRTGLKTENFVVYRSLSHAKIREILATRSRPNTQSTEQKEATKSTSTTSDRSRESKQDHDGSYVYTKIYKHVLERSAINNLGYEFKETQSFFFIIGWLSDDEVVDLIEESKARKWDARNARSQTFDVRDIIEGEGDDEEDEVKGG